MENYSFIMKRALDGKKSQNPGIFQTSVVSFFFAATTMKVLGKKSGFINQSLLNVFNLRMYQ